MHLGEGDFARGLADRGISWKAPGTSTVKYLDSLGVLETKPLLIHCVTVDADDIELIAKRGARVVHCPKSNAKLGHGIAPLAALQDQGIRVGLGTDSVASNNRCDLLDEARFCCLLHRTSSGSFDSPSAEQMLRLATLEGARALGIEHDVGSLEVGKQADLIALDLSQSHTTPVNDPVAALIFSSTSTDVLLTAVAGRVLYEAGEVRVADEASTKSRVETARCKML
jgi:5-methylthioadenosine/S-adenosylhomocysteine deaminase